MQRSSAANVCSHPFLAGLQCRCNDSCLAFSFLSLQSYLAFLLMRPPTLRCHHLRNSTHHRFLLREGLGVERHAAIILYLGGAMKNELEGKLQKDQKEEL